jgi:hypothetical protein
MLRRVSPSKTGCLRDAVETPTSPINSKADVISMHGGGTKAMRQPEGGL